MALNDLEDEEAREEHEHIAAILEKLTGLTVNTSPLKLAEIEELDKLDPKTFLDVEFKNFGQQQDLTKKAFVHCMSKNVEVLEAVSNPRFGPLFKERKKKKTKTPKKQKLAVREEEEHEDLYPRPWTWTDAWDGSVGTPINWTAELDAVGESVLLDTMDILRALEQDPNIADEVSIVLDEGTSRQQLPEEQSQEVVVLDDFGASLMDPRDVERQILTGFPDNACFPQDSSLDQHVPSHLRFPEASTSHISQVREENGQPSSLVESGNVRSVRDTSNIKRTSNIPLAQPLTKANVNVTEEGSVALEPIPIEVPVQTPLEPLVDPIERDLYTGFPFEAGRPQHSSFYQHVPPHFRFPEPGTSHISQVQEENGQPRPVEEVVTEQEAAVQEGIPDQEVVPLLNAAQIDTPEQEAVTPPPPRVVRPKKLKVHKTPVYRHLQLKRVHFPLVNVNLRDTDDLHLDNFLKTGMHVRRQPENMHYSDVLDEYFAEPSQPFLPPSEANILRPSDCHVTQPIRRRTSSILQQISESPIPLMPTLANIMQEEQQHLDSMVLTSQEVNNDLLRFQRKLGHVPPRVDLHNIDFVHELPTLGQLREVESAQILMSYENNHPDIPLPTHSNIARPQKPEYTEEEKGRLSIYFKLLTLRSQTGHSTFLLAQVVGRSGNHTHKLVTLMKLTWEQPPMVKVLKDPNSNTVTHVQLIGFEDD